MTIDKSQGDTRQKSRDNWEGGDDVFQHSGWRWAIAPDLSSCCIGPIDTGQAVTDAAYHQQDGATVAASGTETPLAPDVTDNLRQCAVCGQAFFGRADAKTCGTRCRQRRRREVLVS